MPKKQKPKSKPSQHTSALRSVGYVAFSKDVVNIIGLQYRAFLRVALIAVVSMLVIIGVSTYSYYAETAISIGEFSAEAATGIARLMLEISALMLAVVSGTALSTLSILQLTWLGLILFLTFAVTIWLLRQQPVAKGATIRDGLYVSGAPLVPSIAVGLWAIVQLLPLALTISVLSLLFSAGGFSNPAVRIAALVLILLAAVYTLYWLVSTLIAAVIVTIPGTYPLGALRSAKELVRGYRFHLLKRLLWLGGLNLVAFIILAFPLLLLDILSGYRFGAAVVLVLQLGVVALFIYNCSYLFSLYRRIVDERTK